MVNLDTYEILEMEIKALTKQEKMDLAKYISIEEIKKEFDEMREKIADRLKTITQSLISTELNKGYSTGKLFNSIYIVVEKNEIKIRSTEAYFEILNRGYAAFDMKKALQGKVVKMRLPNGQVIFRRCGNDSSYKKPSWIHPGQQPKNLDIKAIEQMNIFIYEFVKETLKNILDEARNRKALNI